MSRPRHRGEIRHRVLYGSFAAWSLSLTQCSASPVDAPVVPAPSSDPSGAPPLPSTTPRPTGSAAVEPGMDLDAERARRVVTPSELRFKHLYTWTTEEQLAELAGGAPLLSRSVSGKHGVSAFDDLVASDVALGKESAKLLWYEGYAKKRFAWPVLFAALRGSPEPVYGNVLIDVVMRDEAFALDYESGQVFALDGSSRTLGDVRAHPERLGVVYHQGEGFREIVIVNESMVERFSAGASRLVNDALRSEADYLIALAASLDDPNPRAAREFNESLIFADPFSPTALRERAKLLDRLRGLPLATVEREGASSFTLGKPRAPLAPICKLVRRDSRKLNYGGSFPRASQTQYTAVCDAGDRGDEACIAGSGYTPNEANCTPSDVFGE